MVMILTSLEDIQNSVLGSTEWSKFGSKAGDPFLSIFNENIKKVVAAIKYEAGQTYNFTDGEFEYKIDVEQVGEAPKFTFYIKPKQTKIISSKKSKKPEVGGNNNLIIGIVVFVLIEFLVLVMLGVFQALFR
jgi:hypothetical protein